MGKWKLRTDLFPWDLGIFRNNWKEFCKEMEIHISSRENHDLVTLAHIISFMQRDHD